PLLAFSLARSLADLPWQQRMLSLALRMALLFAMGLALARPVRTAETTRVCTVLLLDVSDSVSDESLEDARRVVRDALAARPPNDLLKVVTFARRPRLLDLGEAREAPPVSALRHDGGPASGGGRDASAGTDLAAALDLAYSLFAPGYVKRAVLVTDGVETDGDVLAESARAREFGVRVHAVPLRRPPPP